MGISTPRSASRLLQPLPTRPSRGAPAPKNTFSCFVHSLATSDNGPDAETFDLVWTALRAVLRREIRRRDLWHLPPSYLGVSGRPSWLDAEATSGRGAGRHDDALEELTADCYTYVFLTRLDSLRAQLKVKGDIEGIVLLSVRSFLLERQRQCDPIGSRVYDVLRSAARRAVVEKICVVVAGDRRIRNDTVLAIGRRRYSRADALLVEAAREWADDLLPDLMTAVGRAQSAVEGRIVSHLLALSDRGVGEFRFGALLNPLKLEVRSRWRTMFHRGLGDVALEEAPEEGHVRLVRSIQPDTSFEERQAFEILTTRIVRELEEMEADRKTLRYLQRLWGFLRIYALEDEISEDRALADGRSRKRPPSQREISAELRIPRDRLPGLLATLGELIAKHRPGRLIAFDHR